MICDLITTIIPVFNRSALLREAVASVLAQDYRPIEVIVVDDGSTDETGRVAEELAARHPAEIRVLHIANGGPGAAREAGRQAAQGEFVQYLDSDDLLLPGKFTAQVAGLRACSECGVAYGKTGYGRDTTRPWKRTGERIEAMWPSFLQARWWDTSTPLYRREVTDAAGPWESLRQEEDWVYDCRAAARGTRLCYIDQFVSLTGNAAPDRLSGNTASSRYWRDRAAAHRLIWECVKSVGPDFEQPELRHFARELFLLARQCGAAGLADEARELFQLALAASGPERGSSLDFRLYRMLASVAGWTQAGRLACAMDRWRQ
ncbi:MAG: glycosyltransferase family 2 protein [Candidatus Contendobacter sp.]|nr:glycosyltransferase family 2 protein [Candidatus Contendobacter sp.]